MLGAWWVFFVVVFATTGYYARLAAGRPASWSEAFQSSLLNHTILALLALAAFALAWRLPLDGGQWRRSLLIHLAAAVLLLAGWALLYDFLSRWIDWIPDLPLAVRLQTAPANGVIYGAFVGVGYALAFYQQFRERELRAAQLEARLAHTQLQALRTQLQPRFLFNTLRGISELMYRDVRAAERMLARLGDLLRLMLERRGEEEVALKDELDFMDLYLEVEHMRRGERLQVERSIDPRTLEARIPHLLFQPVLESVLPHALGSPEAPERIAISTRRIAGLLQLQVCSSGTGAPATDERLADAGSGLEGTRARLAQLYNGGHRFEVDATPGGGRAVKIVIPFRSESEELESARR